MTENVPEPDPKPQGAADAAGAGETSQAPAASPAAPAASGSPSAEPSTPPSSPPPSAPTADAVGAEPTPAEPPSKEQASDAAADPPRRKRKRRKKGEAKAASTQEPKSARRSLPRDLVAEGMNALVDAIIGFRKRAGWRRIEGKDEAELELTLKLPLRRSEIAEAARKLAKQLRHEIESEVIERGSVVPGRTWCFQTGSFNGEFSRPSDPRQVLVGYGLEGRPRFADLVTYAIEQKHEAVDDLLAGREGAVSFVCSGAAITEGVKPAFDPQSVPFQLVGQAMTGLFPSVEEGRRVALTVQVLEHEQDGRWHLLAHPVCAVDLLDLPDPSVPRMIRRYQDQLNQLAGELVGKRAAGEEADTTQAVLSSLRDLTKRMSAEARNRERKTGHARERQEGGQRPTQLAFPEARSARDHHLYFDTEEGTIVVIGKKGRVHVFSPDGRHVTTVVLSPQNVRQRVRAGRWRQAEPAERGSFREAIANKNE